MGEGHRGAHAKTAGISICDRFCLSEACSSATLFGFASLPPTPDILGKILAGREGWLALPNLLESWKTIAFLILTRKVTVDPLKRKLST